MKQYRVVNGVSYDAQTNDKVIEVLNRCMVNRIRIRVYYGDVKTGRSWMDEHDIEGYVGHSTGGIKIPLLVYNNRSYGGGGMLDACIIKIVTTAGKTVLYQHPKFHTPYLNIIPNGTVNDSYSLLCNGEVYATGNITQMSNLCKRLS